MSVRQWKQERPFLGSILTLLSGALILWVPLNLIVKAFLPGTVSVIGILFGGLVLLIGIMGLFFPQFSKVFGIVAIFLSILSIIGALGGFIVGTLLGITGGSLMVAWSPPASDRRAGEQPSEETEEEIYVPHKMVQAK
ncbi:DUF6114 domain-containing protein [Fictibacillus sp. WQ 8-8]|uniref:DUF6114 domain-containing protein n=1 Tax=unclassified Fictibacillus TaxID=2644029 RepID=UPI0006A76D53|nr:MULTISPECIES: DUF6114 domain-containing protein [unclassified Fictibacillus]MCQ6266825.1 DUF6114 domain-containing protein [Fictibacillus sp. WQ 8-8]MED2973858.1 DUF6114 domain-containing protein [Fictibacillus sp. B-59209]UZJ77998.1 DUF6114 domain-containing protein [Fictibacillus sp. KU28468]SFE37022.1 hypothetical protein SAMN05428981_105114 [Bacillus sp. OV194]